MNLKKTMLKKKGITIVQIGLTLIILLTLIAIALYVTKKQAQEIPMPTPEVQVMPTELKTEIKMQEEYKKEYDWNEYCFDGEIYELRCQDACDPSGKAIQPKIEFVDCKQPKQCCQYPPTEWPNFEDVE
ncbi:hypothetical protein HY488_01695 [Candidatus Woesearchaeota archaeon]|nr:hypothetical protein [Candidatus Woesearchaeota archaeon]